MRHWSFWEWLAYACLLLGAMILAADTGLRLSPELAHSAPFLSSPYWGFAPLGLVMGATAVLVAKEFGWLQALGLQHPLNLFLERDSSSNLLGIHTFSGVTYIQISVASSKRVTDCKAWYRESYFSPDGIQPLLLSTMKNISFLGQNLGS